jgi:SAM-dependent methyltransferase
VRSLENRLSDETAFNQQNVAFEYSTATTALPRRNLVQRVLNRIGRGFGISPFPVAFDSVLEHAGDREEVFAEIYDKNVWGSPESRSGPGSEIKRTERYRNELVSLLKRRKIQSIFDAPCGDLNWMSLVLDEWPIGYVGGDISDVALESARQRRPGVDVRHFDICADPLPDAQLWHCRDSLFHLSFADIWLSLRNAAASNVEYALITTNRARLLKNMDIRTGGCRVLDLERPPFSLSRPLEYLVDTAGGQFPRFVGLWTVDAISEAVEHASPLAQDGD